MKRFAWILLLWPSLASATKVSVSVHPCPLGEGSVKVYEKLSSNTLGGFDSDLAAYSSKGQFREYAISTCADNLLSLYGTDMVQAWTDEEKLRMKETLDRIHIH